MKTPVTEDEVRQFASEQLGVELLPWQSAWLTRMLNDDDVFWNMGRLTGRRTTMWVASEMLAELDAG